MLDREVRTVACGRRQILRIEISRHFGDSNYRCRLEAIRTKDSTDRGLSKTNTSVSLEVLKEWPALTCGIFTETNSQNDPVLFKSNEPARCAGGI